MLVCAAGLGFVHTLTLGSLVGVATVAVATTSADALAVAPTVGDALEDAPVASLAIAPNGGVALQDVAALEVVGAIGVNVVVGCTLEPASHPY